jgi:DNA repair photolyase
MQKKVISASRRTDLVAFFPGWLAEVLEREEARVCGPSGRVYPADLRPASVHTIVLWSKDFSNLTKNQHGLRDSLEKYDQTYFLFTITGLGGSFIERGVPPPAAALSQLPTLIEIAGSAKRVSVRFDPVIYWKDGDHLKTNLEFFEEVAEHTGRLGIEDIRMSFTQWYGKALRRAKKSGFSYVDPPQDEKMEAARRLAEIAGKRGVRLFACSQNFLTRVPGIQASSCIDGRLLQELHPRQEAASSAKDKSQRPECGCTESVDIGSYTQSCPHCCLYCYANPKIS